MANNIQELLGNLQPDELYSIVEESVMGNYTSFLEALAGQYRNNIEGGVDIWGSTMEISKTTEKNRNSMGFPEQPPLIRSGDLLGDIHVVEEEFDIESNAVDFFRNNPKEYGEFVNEILQWKALNMGEVKEAKTLSVHYETFVSDTIESIIGRL